MESKQVHIDYTYRQQKAKLLNFIRKSLPLEQAEDVLHDVFTQLFDGYDRIRSIENISSWLYKSARNRIIDLKRKKKPELLSNKRVLKNVPADSPEDLYIEDILPAFSDDPEEELFRQAIWQQIMDGLEELPVEQREVFILHEFEDRSFNEISSITGEKVNTLISRKRYAVLYLREKLFDLYEQLKQ